MRLLDKMMIVITTICIMIFGIWISAIPITKSSTFYYQYYQKAGTAEELDLTDAQLALITAQLIDYLIGNTEDLQIQINGENFFSEKAITHMKDVKGLYIAGQSIAVISFVCLLGCIVYIVWRFPNIKKSLFPWTLVAIAIIIALIGVFMLWGYQEYKAPENRSEYLYILFINFHKVIFLGQMDKVNTAIFPAYDTLTRLLDMDLFMRAGIIIGICTLVCLILWLIITILCRKYGEKILHGIKKLQSGNTRVNQNQNTV